MPQLTRRHFLTAATGLAVPIPYLASLAPGCASKTQGIHPLIVMRAASGVAQQEGELPELWWPRQIGPLTRDALADEQRATSELGDWAERLLVVRGTRFAFEATRELHAGGGNQLLTGAKCGPLTDTVMTYAMGESIDNWIARQSAVNGGEPLTLYAGRRDDYGEEVLSYRGPQRLRSADSDPWEVYRRLIGAGGTAEIRGSINDLVLDQLHALQTSRRISRGDVALLDQHTDAIRDFEGLCARVSSATEQAMADLAGMSADDGVSLEVARLHCDLIALVLACDQARAVTLQVGDRLDRCRYTWGGVTLPSYHELTHGLVSAEDLGDYPSTHHMHADVNRLHLQVYAYLLDRLDERGLLDGAVAVFCSDVATGSHSYQNVPWIIAGKGDGSLRTGQYVDAGDVTHDRLLATLLTATGHRTPEGDPIDRFGDETLPGGLIPEMLA